MVNRVWQHYFGQGLVRTPSDFGMRSDPPTHPDLLDHLASAVHGRRLVAQAPAPPDPALEYLSARRATIDRNYNSATRRTAGLSRMNRRRLDLEALRDALLTSAGTLDETLGGPAVELTTRAVHQAADGLWFGRTAKPAGLVPHV